MIDHATVEKITMTANIVEVVGDFVTLRRSGSNYKGLCPFHDERTPSFIVTPSKNICHCFGCGKGGNPVNFIMEHEQISYPEALRWLANKYHIDIQETELTNEEREQQSAREAMFVINEWTAKHFEDTLHENVDGLAVGMPYFRQRGIRDDIIRKFRLGYALPNATELAQNAKNAGYNEKYLLGQTGTGTCYRRDNDNALINRFYGRVIFPWIGLNGKVVAFGGRVLDSRTKGVNQKYVNSPESEIFHKERELYGIYQAKRAISKEDCVYMVEGYTDVIAMHQCGIENVVANSGTALSSFQVHILHRLTHNITLLYDGDKAGIKAAIRGIDMLLHDGMNVKVMLLPDGDDPDSFSRKHTADEFRQYIAEHQQDFIRFKIELLLDGVTDPFQRSEAIGSIVQSIAVIPNPILRDTYLTECARLTGMAEQTLIAQLNKCIANDKNEKEKERERAERKAEIQNQQSQSDQQTVQQNTQTPTPTPKIENDIIRMVLRHGERIVFHGIEQVDGTLVDLTIAEYIYYNLECDGLMLHDVLYNRVLQEAVEHSHEEDFIAERYFSQHTDINISKMTNRLIMQKYTLSRSQIREATDEHLRIETERLIGDMRMLYLDTCIKELSAKMRSAGTDTELMGQIFQQYNELIDLRKELAIKLGINIRTLK